MSSFRIKDMIRSAMILNLFLSFMLLSPSKAYSGNRKQESLILKKAAETQSPLAPSVLSEHRIGIRTAGERPEFYDRETDESFILIGSNFHNLGPEKNYFVDRLFSPNFFDPKQVNQEMQAMHAYGYNVIRTSLDMCREDCIGALGGGLRGEYLDNVVDFLRLAKENGLLIIITSNDLPLYAGYISKVESTCCNPFDGYINSHYLSPVGVAQWTEYWQDVVHALIERNAPLDVILAYQVRGELFLSLDKPPLSLTSGLVTTANGKPMIWLIPRKSRR